MTDLTESDLAHLTVCAEPGPAWPHLQKMGELVAEMEECVAIPWRWPRWVRCYRQWKRERLEHKADMALAVHAALDDVGIEHTVTDDETGDMR
jgi:hypothetical protein